jgi:formylglycine-generating enzyme required for sulfatase activity
VTVDRRCGLAALALLLLAGCVSLPESVSHGVTPPEMAPIAGGIFAMGATSDAVYGHRRRAGAPDPDDRSDHRLTAPFRTYARHGSSPETGHSFRPL